MANSNFVVQNGLTVGPYTVFAGNGDIITTGNITTTGSGSINSANGFGGLNPQQIYNGTSNVTVNSGNIQMGVSGANVLTVVPATLGNGNLILNGSMIPGANVVYDLGSKTSQWHSVYVGPGTLYINGKPVLQDNSGTITVSTTAGQNLQMQTTGGGILQLSGNSDASGGYVSVQSTMQIQAGNQITSSDGNSIKFGNQIGVDSITTKTNNTNLSLAAQGTGKISINNSVTGGGTVTFSDATASTTSSSGAVVVTGGVGVGGDLRVAGNVYSYGVLAVQTQQLQVNAPLVYLAATPYPYSYDIGTYSHFIGGAANAYGHTGFVRSQANNYWGLFSNVASEPTTTVNWSDGSLVWDTAKMGALVLANTTAATSATTGALQVAGGAGIAGNVFTSGWIVPTGNTTQNLGTTSSWWGTLYGVSTQARYADLAENYQGDAPYMPGQVVEFGGAREVTLGTADSTAVAGVVSTNPAHLMNGALTGTNVVAVALQGRVPCNVIGPVKKGQMMVSAGFGYAKTSTNPQVGQLIGKALQDFDGAKGQIEVVVGRS